MALTLMYITNKPEVALIAEKYGVERVWIDLETLGKEERQKGMNTVKSKHTITDIHKVKAVLSTSDMLVRVNPWNETSAKEINDVVAAGADIIMLPMWKTVEEVKKFISAVDGRCRTVLLLETREAAECLDEVLRLEGIDEIHIGLNDLHLSYGLSFMFELLANGTVDVLTRKIAAKGIPYGFGGIASLGNGDLPAEKVIMEHYRLGSTRAILSRSFCDTNVVTDMHEVERIFGTNMKKLRDYEKSLEYVTDFSKNQAEVKAIVEKIVEARKGKANDCK